jgi:hypothetical protein
VLVSERVATVALSELHHIAHPLKPLAPLVLLIDSVYPAARDATIACSVPQFLVLCLWSVMLCFQHSLGAHSRCVF